MLRERRGLSLDDVASLSRTFADPIQKSYLSRCENGRHSLAISKLIPLSRIYEVPAEVILERLELDMELEKVGGPETVGLSYAQLTARGKETTIHGELWDAYGCLRDALLLAPQPPLLEGLRDLLEQSLRGLVNYASAAANLGRPRLALEELEYVQAAAGLSSRSLPILFERLARTYRALNQLELARHNAELAIREGEAAQLRDYLGYFYGTRARIALQESEVDRAVALYQRAFDSFRAAGQEHECTTTLLNLAQVYFDTKRHSSARRALLAAERFATPRHQHRARALARILLGEIDCLAGHHAAAANRWREASAIAKQLNDRTLRFKAEFPLYKLARHTGDSLSVRALQRRLERLSHWIREEVVEVAEFRAITSEARTPRRKRVAVVQRSK